MRPSRSRSIALLWLLLSSAPTLSFGDPIDLLSSSADLVRMEHGGVLDPADALTTSSEEALRRRVLEGTRDGGAIWVLILPSDADLVAAIKIAGGRLSPTDDDLVVVASPRGVQARYPRLGGRSDLIDEAFTASRRALVADLAGGIVEFIDHLDEGGSRVRHQESGLRLLLSLGLLILTGYAFGRYRQFRVKEERWTHEDRKVHQALVAQCRARLQAVGVRPSGADQTFVSLKEQLDRLAAAETLESRLGLERFLSDLESDSPDPGQPALLGTSRADEGEE